MKPTLKPTLSGPLARGIILLTVSSLALLAGCSTWQRQPAATVERSPVVCSTHVRNLATVWEAGAYSCQARFAALAPRERSLAPRVHVSEPRLAGVNDAP